MRIYNYRYILDYLIFCLSDTKKIIVISVE